MSPFPASQAALGLATTGAAFGTATVGAGMQASGQGASGAAADAAASGAAVHPALRGLPAPPPGPWAPPGAPPHSPPPTAGAQAWAPSSAQPTHQPPTDATGATSLEEAPSRRALRGFLYSFHGDPNGAFWPLFAGRNVIGRGGSGEVLDIEIHDPTTSSRHGVIAFDTATGVCYEDAGSTNGSFVNDQPVGYRGSVELHDGDRIRFGGFNAAVKFVSR
jgi:pSer/pThr/pTyr-binding forkhead associated (FHA) protein